MSAVRIGPKHQITVPKDVFEALNLKAGDYLDASTQGGRLVLTPLQLGVKVPAPHLTPAEQQILARARLKIERIRRDLLRAKGLTTREAQVAAKAGLIDSDQMYWWTESWQKGERAAEGEVQAGRLLGPFSSVDAFKQALRVGPGART